MKTGSESIEAIIRRRRTLFSGFVVRMEGTRLTAGVRDVRRTGGGRGLREGEGKKVHGVFPGRPQSFAIFAD